MEKSIHPTKTEGRDHKSNHMTLLEMGVHQWSQLQHGGYRWFGGLLLAFAVVPVPVESQNDLLCMNQSACP